MKLKSKYSSEIWCNLTGITVYDPDGWDRKGDLQADWDKPITLREFLDKASVSTTCGMGFKDEAEIEKLVIKNIHWMK